MTQSSLTPRQELIQGIVNRYRKNDRQALEHNAAINVIAHLGDYPIKAWDTTAEQIESVADGFLRNYADDSAIVKYFMGMTSRAWAMFCKDVAAEIEDKRFMLISAYSWYCKGIKYVYEQWASGNVSLDLYPDSIRDQVLRYSAIAGQAETMKHMNSQAKQITGINIMTEQMNEIVPVVQTTALSTLSGVLAHAPNDMLLRGITNRSYISRVSLYVNWLDENGGHWTNPSLDEYARYLLSDERYIEHGGKVSRALSPASAKIHLSTIRTAYNRMMSANFKALLIEFVNKVYPNKSEADRRALRLDMLETMQDALNPDETKFVKLKTVQDKIDSEHIRLSPSQAESLVHTPGIHTLIGLRDTALLYFMLSTGLREAEICNLDVNDLRQKSGEQLGVYVRDGKGAKSRFVPYGDLADCLVYVDAWLAQSGITKGAVFRGFKDKHTPHFAIGEKSPETISNRLTERLNVRSINYILKQYPVSIDGHVTTLCPHDTRRSYARMQYDSGMDIIAIRDNLGHADMKTTQGYIGDMNMEARRGKQVIKTNHDKKLLQSLGTVERLI